MDAKTQRKASHYRCQLPGFRRHGGEADHAAIMQDGETKGWHVSVSQPRQFAEAVSVVGHEFWDVDCVADAPAGSHATAELTNHGILNVNAVKAYAGFDCEAIKRSHVVREALRRGCAVAKTSNCSHMSSTSTTTTRMHWSARDVAATTKLTSVTWQELMR